MRTSRNISHILNLSVLLLMLIGVNGFLLWIALRTAPALSSAPLDWLLYAPEKNPHQRFPNLKIRSASRLFAIPGGPLWVSVSRGGVWSYHGDEWRAFPSRIPGGSGVRSLRSLFFLSENLGWVGTGDGRILRTGNGGESWELAHSGAGQSLESIFFVNEATGWAVGAEGLVFRTRDGGRRWSATNLNAPLDAAFFLDEERGWIAGGRRGTVFRTRDGGNSFEEFRSPAVYPYDLQFLDSLRGFITGLGGVYTTTDGGETWRPLSNRFGYRFRTLRFKSATAGRAFARDDNKIYLLETVNAGVVWEIIGEFPDPSARKYFIDGAGRALLVSGGMLYVFQAGGWAPLTAADDTRVNGIHFWDERRGLIVADRGHVFVTEDGGETFELRQVTGRENLNAVYFQDENTGWIVGDDGLILTTLDGGRTFRDERAPGSAALNAIFPRPDGVVIAGDGLILEKRTGAEQWTPASLDGPGANLYGGCGNVTVGLNGAILVRRSSGWAPVELSRGTANPAGIPLFSCVDNGQVIVGASGSIYGMAEGQFWNSGVRATLRSVAKAGSENYVVVGSEGTVLIHSGSALSSGGKSSAAPDSIWRRVDSGVRDDLRSVHFTGALRGWAGGSGFRVYRTEDGGQTWSPPDSGPAGPALWFYLTLTISAGLAFLLVRSLYRGFVTLEEQAEHLRTDRAIEHPGQDVLNFTPLARTVANFIRNKNTRPPVTFAVDAPWGGGKSSLMNLVRLDLKGRGFHPVWFNAWHFQRDEQILAALLEHFRSEAVPRLFSSFFWRFFSFRARLLIGRIHSLKWWLLVLVVFLSVNAGFYIEHGKFALPYFTNLLSGAPSSKSLTKQRELALKNWIRSNPREVLQYLERMQLRSEGRSETYERPNVRSRLAAGIRDDPDTTYGFLLEQMEANKDHPDTKAIRNNVHLFFAPTATEADIFTRTLRGLGDFGDLIVFALLLTRLFYEARAFRSLKPYLSGLSRKLSLDKFDKEAGFRFRFQREFQEVTRALKPYPMVIFIDDLDRCLDKYVLNVLEVVNFLNTSGDCFIILGLDYRRVERILKQAHKDDPDFNARNYLEKLIQLRIELPGMSSEHYRKILTAPVAPDDPPPETGGPLIPWILPSVFAVICIAALYGGFLLAQNEFLFTSPAKEGVSLFLLASGVEPETPEATAGQPGTVDTGNESGSDLIFDLEEEARSAVVEGIHPPRDPVLWNVGLLLLGFLVFLVIALARSGSRTLTRDSPALQKALRHWSDFLARARALESQNDTPRALKRFLNHIRFFIMEEEARDEIQRERIRSGLKLEYALLVRKLYPIQQLRLGLYRWWMRRTALISRRIAPTRKDEDVFTALGVLHFLGWAGNDLIFQYFLDRVALEKENLAAPPSAPTELEGRRIQLLQEALDFEFRAEWSVADLVRYRERLATMPVGHFVGTASGDLHQAQ